ncbi:equilibrative nucleoside transporter 1 isoform X2 [Strongylocentrotus purpuratus]|uniref:Equilibrative nucleoside transporter 1 n=1 Tax=Strongylocentrotus purpuratus TaxID=7668 RepID=A0A7M7T5F4_STRPU|nr:equilibrative nucleoside transporter 1 isoform X2 [Strongylocentrotus purpuratus]
MEDSTMSERTALLEDVDHFSDAADTNGYVNHDDVEIKSGRASSDVGPAENPPTDRYRFVYVVFYIFGMCSVLPWNMFITAQNYFDYKFSNHDESNTSTPNATLFGMTETPIFTSAPQSKTELQDMYESYFSIAAQVPNVVIQLVNTGIKHKITLKVRMITSLTGMLVIFIFTTVLTRVDTNGWEQEFFWVTLASVVVINCFSAVFQGSVFGLGGLLPKKYTQALMAGQGLGGIVPALVSIICLATLNDNSLVGFVYFLISVICIFITYGAYLVLPRNKYAEYYLNKQASPRTGMIDVSASFSSSFEEKKTTKPPFWKILSQIWVPGSMVFLTFAVTLGNFPGVISQIESMQQTEWTEKYFTPLFCFLLFNGMDFFGRSMSFIQQPSQNHMGIVSLLVVLRLGFFPLFALCNVSPDSRNSEVIFMHDAYPIVFMFFFAVSNGYLGSLCMMYGPKYVQPEHQETAGNMMAFFLVLGLATGSAISVLVLYVL